MPSRARLVRVAPLVASAAVLVWHSLQFNFVTDDAFISFVYSRNLAEHGELTFNLGDRVEGYTNFLWTVILGGLMKLGIPPELSSRVLGTACAIGTLVVVWRLAARALPAGSPWSYLPPLLLAWSSGFACWSSGGLETQLFTLLVSLAVDGYAAAAVTPARASDDGADGDGAAGSAEARRGLRRMGIFLALASMTRPEGPMVAAVLAAHRVVVKIARRRIRPERAELEAVAGFLILWAPWFAWRWWYYGWPFPNTYYVKAAGPWVSPRMAQQMTANGLYYLWRWLQQTHLSWALPLVAIGLAARPRTPRLAIASLVGLLAAVYLAYTVSVGGDFMGLHRFIMPVFVLAALLVTLGLERVASWLPRSAGAALAAVVVAAFAWSQWRLTGESLRWGNFRNDRGIDTPAFLITYTDDRARIGKAMAGCFRPDDFTIVGGAGAQPYYARMRGIDVFGLVSSRIAHQEPRANPRAGHTKFGSPDLLASYRPTFVMSCYDIHRERDRFDPRNDCAPYWLGRGYEHITMHVPGMRERGEYYTFLARKDRAFACPGATRAP